MTMIVLPDRLSEGALSWEESATGRLRCVANDAPLPWPAQIFSMRRSQALLGFQPALQQSPVVTLRFPADGALLLDVDLGWQQTEPILAHGARFGHPVILPESKNTVNRGPAAGVAVDAGLHHALAIVFFVFSLKGVIVVQQ